MRLFFKLVIVLFLNTNLLSADDKVVNIHEGGLQFTGYYFYDEPHFMNTRYQINENKFPNLGFVYNFTQQRIIDDHLYQFEVDTDYKTFDVNYWSNATGTDREHKNEIMNLRLLGGMQITDNLKLKTGYGYRYLKHHASGIVTTTGHLGYDRGQEYRYIPLIAEVDAPIGSLNGIFELEYDFIIYGKNDTYKTTNPTSTHKEIRNDDGYMVKASYKFPYDKFNFEPYYIFQNVQKSDPAYSGGSNFFEPHNTTNEYGIKITQVFGQGNSKRIKDGYVTPINGSSSGYFGAGMMMNRIDTHFESLTGTASLDEKNLGYKLFAGISASEKTDFEFAFNNFGEAVLSCNNGDTFVTANGNLQNGKWSPGTTLTCLADGVASNIRADSVSLTAKPKIIENNVFEIIPIIGIHNWHVNETTVTTGVSTTTFNYTGTDLVHGIEIKSKPENNFTVSFGYSKYPMYYDASAYEFNIGYKF